MYLIIDEQYRIYKSKILNGRIRALAKDSKLSVINLATMQGINSTLQTNPTLGAVSDENALPDWSDIQELPKDFEVEESDQTSDILSLALRAICLTRDYVGPKMLPAIAGWEWYEAGKKLAEAIPDDEWAEQFNLRIANT